MIDTTLKTSISGSSFFPLSISLDSINMNKILRKNKLMVLIWSFFAFFLLFSYHFLSDGDFSFFLTLSSIMNCFGFILVLYKILVTKSVSGISMKTIFCFIHVYLCRCIVITGCQAYLPYDKSGDWLYQFIEILTLVTLCYVFILIKYTYSYTHNSHQDTYLNICSSSLLSTYIIIGPCILIGLFFHSNLSDIYIYDFLWYASHLLETLSILPELYMIKKSRNETIHEYTSNFIFCLFISRLFSFFFWISSYKELNIGYTWFSSHFSGQFLLITQIFQLFLMTEYVYFYIKAAIDDAPMKLPTFQNERVD
ncbi:hypothetical protein WA158_004018 [Blastocystis sp. Blastoise]